MHQVLRNICRSAVVLALSLAFPGVVPAQAQESWPTKSIRLIVPFAAGGNTDTIARLVAERLTTSLPATIVVENIPGGGGVVATQTVARATADGSTLMLAATPQLAIVPRLQQVSFDPIKDFQPIKNIAFNPFVLVVHKSVPAANLKELFDWGRSNPGKLTYASGGQGGVSHLSCALLFAKAGISATHVAYRGNAPAQADVVAGHIPMIFSNLSDALTQANNPDVRLLAVSSTRRSQLLPDVPTVSEQGMAGFDTVAWNGLVAPAGLPAAILARLEKEIADYVRLPATRARFADLGLEPDNGTSSDFAGRIRADITAWAEAIQLAGIK